ncbi:MAG: porin family protein [Deltaproteobacteria bacterium]|nr:MAG: porin family protein [Deltaproteobacteria bacterium]
MRRLTSSKRFSGKRTFISLLLISILCITFITPSFAQIQPEKENTNNPDKTTEEPKRPEDKKKEETPVSNWGLGLSGGIYQSNQSGASPGFILSLTVRYRINLNLANDLALGYAQYGLKDQSSNSLTVRQIPITDSVVFFFQPDSNIVPYLITGTGVWITTISGEEIEGQDKNSISWGGQVGGGIRVATENFGLNFRLIYLIPDFGVPEDGAIQYGLAVGVGR